jgi:hypothetical protein
MNRIGEMELTTMEMCEAASCPHKKFWQGLYSSKLKPLKDAGFKKTRYSLCQCLAISCARLMHTKFGVAPVDMSLFVSRLWDMSVAELEAELAKGNTVWLLVNRVPGDAFFPPTIVNDVARILKERGVTAEVIAVSLEREWQRILDRVIPKSMVPAEVN